MRVSKLLLLPAILAAMWLSTVSVWAGGYHCGPCDEACYQLVEKTVYVPHTVMETRTIHVTQCRPEVRERTVTVYKRIPETRQVTQTYTVMIPEHHTRTCTFTVRVPVWREVTQHYTAYVPHQETRQGMRTVCRRVPVQETRTVCRDMGHWEQRTCHVPCWSCCGGCNTCVATYSVWVPNLVTEEVPVTVWKTEVTQEPYQYTHTVCKPEPRTRTVRVCDYRLETRTKQVPYTVCRPEQRTRVCNVTTYRCVPEQRVVQHTVMVPHVVEKQVQVPVCRMVPKTVVCKVLVH